jgi:CBS domain-containing protein
MAQRVRDLMTTDLVTMMPDDTILDAAKKMRDGDVGVVLVCDDGGALQGMVTDRDIVVRALAEGMDSSASLRGIASTDIEAVGPDDDLGDVTTRMRQRAIRRVPVCEGERPIGILSIGDLAIELDDDSALADISAASPNT